MNKRDPHVCGPGTCPPLCPSKILWKALAGIQPCSHRLPLFGAKTNRWLISRMSQLGGVESTPDPLGVGCGCGPLQLKLLLVHEGSHLLRPKMLNLNTLFKAIMLSL